MPYEIRKTGAKGKPWCVFNKDTGDNKGCSTTKAKARAHMRALYAAESGATMGKKEAAGETPKWKELGEQFYELIAKEGLEDGLQAQLDAVRSAFYDLIRPKTGPLGYAESIPDMSFVDADGEVLLCRCWDTDKYYRAAYEVCPDSGEVTIEPSANWVEGEMQFVPTKEKEIGSKEGGKSLPDMVKELWRKLVGGEVEPNGFITKQQADGRYRWISISSTAFKDLDEEIVSTEAVDKSIGRAPEVGYGPLLFWHEKGIPLGTCDFQKRSGLCLVESGLWDETDVAKAAQTGLEANPRYWGISVKFAAFKGAPGLVNNTVVRTVWKDIQIVERSILPKRRASTLFSAIQTEGGNGMLEDHVKELKKLLGDEKLVDFIVAQVDAVNAQGEKVTAIFKEVGDPHARLLAVAKSLETTNPAAAQQIEASVAMLKALETEEEEEKGSSPEATPPKVVVKGEDTKPPTTVDEALVLLKSIGTQMAAIQKEVEALKVADAPRLTTVVAPVAAAPTETPVVKKGTYEAPKVVQEMTARIFGVE